MFLWWFEIHRPHMYIRRWDTLSGNTYFNLAVVRRSL